MIVNKRNNIKLILEKTDKYSNLHPSINPKSNRLYFSSNRPGGYGGMDIYYVDLIDDEFSEPVNLGPDINSEYNESFPYSYNDSTLFYSSDKASKGGKFNIYIATKVISNRWEIESLKENINSKNFYKISEILNTIANKYKIPIIVSTHPRTRKKIEESKYSFSNLIRFLKPQNLSNYLKLQLNAKTVLSDSGTINEESSILNFPALNIREAHERPEAMEETSVMMTGINCERIIQCLEILSMQEKDGTRNIKLVNDYNVENFSEKILRIIMSYTDYTKKNVWKEY